MALLIAKVLLGESLSSQLHSGPPTLVLDMDMAIHTH
uniref:Uncharacterized protein n=1 Tax=Nelumbo nucifera TaxID=4432 RepID=A0A822Z966_NELNU|nr:TPA_asm: hypothetical protein HUJ06_014242 [Nelumbo nucifera]